jgi:ABC-type transport system substrate-binding protein
LKRSVAALILLASTAAFCAPASAAIKTLYVSVAGPLDGCSSISPSATDNSIAIGDLLYPSAFVNGPADALQGSGVGIVAAELNSVSPEVVNYTVGSGLTWSNGTAFNAQSLVSWWQRAKLVPSVAADGYRHISSMTVSANGYTVLATFNQPFAGWSSLFRDVLASGSSLDCRLSTLKTRPTLGFYAVESVTKHSIVLRKSDLLKKGTSRYGRIVISDQLPNTPKWSTNFLGEISTVSAQTISAVSGIASLHTAIIPSTDLTVMAIGVRRANVGSPLFRQALSVSVNRQILINSQYGGATLSVKSAPFALFDAARLPGSSAGFSAPSDCLTCAVESLRAAGYTQIGSGWKSPQGSLVSIRMAVGPSSVDRATAKFIINTWRVIGIPTFQVSFSSEIGAATSVSSGSADVAIFSRSATFGPLTLARSYFGSALKDSYTTVLNNAQLTKLGLAAMADLNPASASATWLRLDSLVTHSFMVRPIFFAPKIQAWSHRFTSLVGGGSVIALVDQIPYLRP